MGRENRHPLVLVVDDEASVRCLARRMLEQAGYNVIEAGSGDDALRFVDQETPIDLLIADVRMPVMDGDEVARRFRVAQPELKVLYVTGFADRLFENHSTLWQGEAFLDKPFSRRGLLEAVSLLLFGRLENADSIATALGSMSPDACAQQLMSQ